MNRSEILIKKYPHPDLEKTGVIMYHYPKTTKLLYLHNNSWFVIDRYVGIINGVLYEFWIPGMDQAYYNTDPKIILDLWKENGQKKTLFI